MFTFDLVLICLSALKSTDHTSVFILKETLKHRSVLIIHLAQASLPFFFFFSSKVAKLIL